MGRAPINLLEDVYGIEKTPSVVIKNERYEGYQPKEKIQEILCEKYDLSCE